MQTVINAEHLQKSYGSMTAVADISLAVQRGEIFGIVGPNGAGKTTAVEMMQGLRTPDGGRVQLLGLDPQRDVAEVRQLVGTQLQSAVLPDRIRVTEALGLYASYYRNPQSVDQLLLDWDLWDKRDAAFETLSGGQRQRLFIALALIGKPEIVFLDELTTGLDPQARRHTWEHVQAIRERGVTVVLVTHFMDEAERLCDRVAVIDRGTVVAADTPARLVGMMGTGQRVTFTAPHEFTAAWLHHVDGVETVTVDDSAVVVMGTGPLLANVAAALVAHGAAPADLSASQVNLEDVFLQLTSVPTADTRPTPTSA